MKLEIPDQRTEDWATPQAEPAPRPTLPPVLAPNPSYAPFLLALGITMLFWGVVSSPIMSAGGLVVFVWSLWMWVREISNDWSTHHAEQS